MTRKISPEMPSLDLSAFVMVEDESELLNLAIHPGYRQKGFGRELMQFYIDFCHQRKIEAFYLETGVKNQPAIRLYRSFAYHPVGIRQKFYPENEDALLMARRASGWRLSVSKRLG